jgi:hypothetical protein
MQGVVKEHEFAMVGGRGQLGENPLFGLGLVGDFELRGQQSKV